MTKRECNVSGLVNNNHNIASMPMLNANSINLNRKSSIPSVPPKNLMKYSMNQLNIENLEKMNKQTSPEKDKMK